MTRWLLLFLLILTGLRLFLGANMELSPNEALAWQEARRLDWGYHSHGPAVALAVRAGTEIMALAGVAEPGELGVRLLGPLFALGTSLLLFSFARRLYGGAVAVWTVLLVNATPLFNVGGALVCPEMIALFFWVAAMAAFWAALERTPGFSLYWPLTGALVGLGFWAQAANALLLFSMALVLAWTRRDRREFRRIGFWTLLAAFALVAAPVVLWNARHDWISGQVLLERAGFAGLAGGGRMDAGGDVVFAWQPTAFLQFLGAHFAVYSPLIFLGMLVALFEATRQRHNFGNRLLLLFTLPLLVLHALLALRQPGDAHWTAPAFVSLGILTAAYWHHMGSGGKGSAMARWGAGFALLLGFAMSLVAVGSDAPRELLDRLGIVWPYVSERETEGVATVRSADPSTRLRGWKTAALQLDALRREQEAKTGQPLFLIAGRWQTAACLGFYLPGAEGAASGRKTLPLAGHPPVYIPESQAMENQFSFWPRYDEMEDPRELAARLLPTVADPAQRQALGSALAELEAKTRDALPPGVSNVAAATAREIALRERRQALLQALLKVDPTLPFDVLDSENWGGSFFRGRSALFVCEKPPGWRSLAAPGVIRRSFESVELLAVFKETRRGLPLRYLWVYQCRNYRHLLL